MDTSDREYTERLQTLQRARWKHLVPDPYRWWLRRLDLGHVLDVGCGLGRSLHFLDGHGVGVDHNADSIAACRAAGLTAYTTDEFPGSPADRPGAYDALLMLHVLEHLQPGEADALLSSYLPYVRPGGRVVLITPQERGFASDPTHTAFVDGDDLVALVRRHGLAVDRWRSFPFPRRAGSVWIYNEFTVVASVPMQG